MPKFATTARARDLRLRQTDTEKLFWSRVRNRRLGGWKFKRQVPIGPYIVDFYVDAVRAVVELDGGQHNEDAHAERDAIRDRWLEKNGYTVIRIWNMHIRNSLTDTLDYIDDRLCDLQGFHTNK